MLSECLPSESTNRDKWLQLKSEMMAALTGKELSAGTQFCDVIPGSRMWLLAGPNLTLGARKLSSVMEVRGPSKELSVGWTMWVVSDGQCLSRGSAVQTL